MFSTIVRNDTVALDKIRENSVEIAAPERLGWEGGVCELTLPIQVNVALVNNLNRCENCES